LEKFYLEKYINLGYIKLNIKSTGNLGRNSLYWTKERCEEVAKLCHTKIEFIKTYNSAYNSARKHNWLDDICKHMIVLKNPNGFWTIKENCRNEALKYKNKKDFKKSIKAYLSSLDNEWMEEFFPSLFNKEKCKNEAIKYKTKKDFFKNNKSLYNIAYNRGWLNEICSHMFDKRKPNGYWTKEICKNEALKYTNIKEFRINSHSCYIIASVQKWLDEICSHMIKFKKPNGYWTKDRCLEIALKYDTKKDFKYHDNSAYLGSKKIGCLDEICSHMIILKKPNGYWTKEKCKDIAEKYITKTDFMKNDRKAYDTSYNKGWLNEICSHMKNKKNNIK
jgi:isopentenyldiphosphate isomerase